ncbi:MAG: arylesterase [Thermoanaerobaculia bacterium]
MRGKRGLTATAAGAVLVAAVWALWPPPASRVANLDSTGSTIVAFGDSLTAGYGAGAGDDYPSRLASALGETIVNAGVSGDTTAAALERIDDDVLARDPRIVIVGLGGNDYLRGVPIATTEANLRAIVRRIQDAGAMVVLLGYRFPSLQVDYGAMYERIADEERALLVPDLLDGILSQPALRSDAIHPNAAGYAILAARVEEPLRELLREAR